jgi:hypothetical protein
MTPERHAHLCAIARMPRVVSAEIKAKRAAGLRAWWATHGPLATLTPQQRADYNLLVTRGGLRRSEALRAIGRADLVKP